MQIASPTMPMTSHVMPTRRTRTGPIRWLSAAPAPEAMNAPAASEVSTTPVCIAEKPFTDCRNSGSVNSNPNSPRLTTRATRFPPPKVRMANSRRSTMAILPRR